MSIENYDKELRMGLVLYGGVSLAIYIYGVVYEFLRLVRAEPPYDKLIREARIKPVIDVISGTSAGGINGLCLAKALATGSELTPLKELWIEDGDLEKLIDTNNSEPLALLNSSYYQQKLYEAFTKMNEYTSAERKGGSLLDVFITATDLDGIIATQKSPYFSTPIQTKQYGTVFHFKVRPGSYDPFKHFADKIQTKVKEDPQLPFKDIQKHRDEINPFEPDSITGQNQSKPAQVETLSLDRDYYLAKVAASTSAFPIAFAPVRFTNQDIDTMKKLFGPGIAQDNIKRSAIYGDGGMINNKPFGHTLRTIFHRHASSPVDRKLFYVEPDPKIAERATRLAEADQDGIQSLLSFFEAALYQSITTDLDLVSERNDHIRQIQGMLGVFEDKLAAFVDKMIRENDLELRDEYQKNAIYPAYRQLKVAQLRQELEKNLLNRLPPETSEATRLAFSQALRQKIEHDFFSGEEAQTKFANFDERAGNFLQQFDYPFRVRRIRYFIGQINRWLKYIEPWPDDTKDKSLLTNQLSLLKAKLYLFVEAYDHSVWCIWDELELDIDPTNTADIDRAFETLRRKHSELMQNYRDETLKVVMSGLEPTMGLFEEIRQKQQTLLQQVDTGEMPVSHMEEVFEKNRALFKAYLENLFNAYEFLDMHLYPLTILAEIGEADPIDVIRISPKDASYYDNRNDVDEVAAKLAGEKLMHFSAFLKKSWRENDLLWGRLDAAEIIARTVLQDQPEKIEETLKELCPAIVHEELESMLNRRKTELKQVVFTENDQAKIQAVLDEQAGENIKATEDYFIHNYRVGSEGFENVTQTYLWRTIAKALRTTERIFQRRRRQTRGSGGAGILNWPLRLLSIVLNLPYIFIVMLGGLDSNWLDRIISYVGLIALSILLLQLFHVISAAAWVVLIALGLVFLFLWPRRRVGLIILVVLLLLAFIFGVIRVKFSFNPPW